MICVKLRPGYDIVFLDFLLGDKTHSDYVPNSHKQIIPNNNPEYSVLQVKRLLRQVEEKLGREISVDEWNDLQKPGR